MRFEPIPVPYGTTTGVATTLPPDPILDDGDLRFLKDFITSLRNYTSIHNGHDLATIISVVRSVQSVIHELPGLRGDLRTLEQKVEKIAPDSSSLENAADIDGLKIAIRDLSERIDLLNPNYGAF